MSLPPAEERKLQRTKIDQLAHIEWLLERLLWTLSPGNLDFTIFRDIVLGRDYHAAQLRKEQGGVLAERLDGNERGQAPKASSSHSVFGEAQGQAEIA